jgi:hypothetical protein
MVRTSHGGSGKVVWDITPHGADSESPHVLEAVTTPSVSQDHPRKKKSPS